ncbi:MAG: methyltransferase domain-containing protein [Chloroflexi bacterium]|nr:methyltransferase domain-containing protein [Chloroflexota bacterium]
MSDSKSLSRDRYNQYAAGYVSSQTHATGTDLERLIAIANSQSNWHVLDIATGGGHTALKFAPLVAHVTVTDIAPKMLEAARQHITGKGIDNVSFKVADAEDLPFEDEGFDLVTCRIAPHHFPNIASFVRESARVLKPGGLLLVQDHVLPEDPSTAAYVDGFEKRRDPGHNFALTENQWRQMFENAGLTVLHTEQLSKRHNFLDWAKRQGNDETVIEELRQMLHDAPPPAAEWMEIQDLGTGEASFVNHHLIIAGCK